MNTEGKVVFNVIISTAYVEEVEMWVARIKELGITSYGRAKADATETAKEMLAERVFAHRQRGNLRDWLSRFSVDWTWENDYSGSLEVEDVSIEADDREFELVA